MNENTDVKDTATPAQGAEQTTTEETVTVPKGKFQSFLDSIGEGLALGLGSKDDAKADKAEESKKADSEKPQEVTDVNKAIAEARKQWEAEANKKAELDKLTGEDKIKAEAEAQRAELVATKQQLAERDLKTEAVDFLSKEGYPVGLADLLNFSSKEAKDESLQKAIKILEKTVETVVKERLRGKTPAGIGGANGTDNLLQNQIAKHIRGGLN